MPRQTAPAHVFRKEQGISMQSSVPAAHKAAQVSVGSHLAFILGSALCMLLLFALARLGSAGLGWRSARILFAATFPECAPVAPVIVFTFYQIDLA